MISTPCIETWAGPAWATRILVVALLLGHAHFCCDPLGAQVWGDIGVYGGHVGTVRSIAREGREQQKRGGAWAIGSFLSLDCERQ